MACAVWGFGIKLYLPARVVGMLLMILEGIIYFAHSQVFEGQMVQGYGELLMIIGVVMSFFGLVWKEKSANQRLRRACNYQSYAGQT
jgi:hypothetical protein